MRELNFVAEEDCSGVRLDKALCVLAEGYTRSFLKRVIDDGGVLLNGKPAEAKTKLKVGDVITLKIEEPKEIDAKAEDIDIDIVYQDEDIAVINKPQGMVVHPANGNYTGTLVNALLFHIKDLSGINGKIRPGIVHRIDKDTSGLLVIAKNDFAHINLAEQIKNKTAHRQYIALVRGNIKEDKGKIDLPIGRSSLDRKKMAVTKGGRNAVTHYEVLRRYGEYTLIKAVLETGRTHQIRVHFAYRGHPVVGDPVYGPDKNEFKLNGQLLHAQKLTLKHPVTGETMEFTAPIPAYFKEVVCKLDRKAGYEEYNFN